jgi:hypothetical protein
MTRSHQVNVNSIRPQETRAAGFLSEKQVQIRYGGEYLKLKAGVPSWKVSGVSGITGAPRSQETAFPQDPSVGLCLWPYGNPRGAAVSCERGAPVPSSVDAYLFE